MAKNSPGDRGSKRDRPHRRDHEKPYRDDNEPPDDDGHDHGDGDGDGEDEEFDDPEEHLEIERQRFAGGLKPTPELYARAREQWYQLPGALTRPPMDPPVGGSGATEQPPAGQPNPNQDRGEP